MGRHAEKLPERSQFPFPPKRKVNVEIKNEIYRRKDLASQFPFPPKRKVNYALKSFDDSQRQASQFPFPPKRKGNLDKISGNPVKLTFSVSVPLSAEAEGQC